MTNADRIDELAAQMRAGDIRHEHLVAIAREMASAGDDAREIADAIQKPWEYAALVIIDEDARAGTL